MLDSCGNLHRGYVITYVKIEKVIAGIVKAGCSRTYGWALRRIALADFFVAVYNVSKATKAGFDPLTRGLARELLTERTEACRDLFEAAFENLSHFSYAFKKRFGYSPKEVVILNR